MTEKDEVLDASSWRGSAIKSLAERNFITPIKLESELESGDEPPGNEKSGDEEPSVNMWTCDKCGEEMKLSQKGAHNRKHNAAAKGSD